MEATDRYDVAIIGAGPDGLAAAAILGRAGLSVIVLERSGHVGGRAVTREFHPGFFASPYGDALAAIPPKIFRMLDLARFGAVPLPMAGRVPLPNADAARARCLAHALVRAERAAAFGWLARPAPLESWPVPDFFMSSLAMEVSQETLAEFLEGRVADPFMAGSALHLLAPAASFGTRGGLGTLGAALRDAARAAGAEISCGLEVTHVVRNGGRVCGVCMADGSQVQARALISTLDVKRSFFGLFKQADLPPSLASAVGQFRMAGGMARLLMALKPPFTRFRDVKRVCCAPEQFAAAQAAWRCGVLAAELPMALRMPSAIDPSLAPPEGAVVTATVSGVPFRRSDGAWTHDRRSQLVARLVAATETVLPGLSEQIVASTLIVPADMEEELGATEGDLLGGEIAPDQMLGLRPWNGNSGARTGIGGYYLAGPSSPAGVLGTCAGGVVAAFALLSDRGGWR